MSGPVLLGVLAFLVVLIVIATGRLRQHPFMVLLAAAYAMGFAGGAPSEEVVSAMVTGFGGTLGSIGIVIAAGSIIGLVLERSGGAVVMADAVVRAVGTTRSVFAMSATGAVVSVPVFCDSGYILLSPLNRSLARRSGDSLAVYAVALSMGLYATHVFVPPTPGPIAAAGELGADLGMMIMLGAVVTVPVLVTTTLFARWMGRRIHIPADEEPDDGPEARPLPERLPSPARAFAPIVVPVLLIALRSIAELPSRPLGAGMLAETLGLVGHPNTALLLGVVLAFVMLGAGQGRGWSSWVDDALRGVGSILLVTAAGGALGKVIQATELGSWLPQALAGAPVGVLGMLLPFVLAAALKTALGSSTVAIVTTAPIVAPLLAGLGLDSQTGSALAALAVGAGAMTVSHANDSYFWVVSQLSRMTVPQAYRLQTLGSAVAGFTGIAAVLLLALMLL